MKKIISIIMVMSMILCLSYAALADEVERKAPTIEKIEAEGRTVMHGDSFTVTVYVANDGIIAEEYGSRVLLETIPEDPNEALHWYEADLKDQGNGKFVATFTVKDWVLRKVRLYRVDVSGKNGLTASLYKEDLPNTVWTVVDDGKDHTPPVVSKVEFSKSVVDRGDSFTVDIYATDESGIDVSSGKVTLCYAENGQPVHYVSEPNRSIEKTGDNKYSATFEVEWIKEWSDGEYIIQSFSFADTNGYSCYGGYENPEEGYGKLLLGKKIIVQTPTKYSITTKYDPEVGSVSIPDDTAAGKTVTFTATPSNNGAVEKITIKTEDGKEVPFSKVAQKENEYQFTMPESNVIINVQFKGGAITNFTDVPAGSWFESAVQYVSDKGYMAGVGYRQFNPNHTVTRAMIAQILYAAEGKPEFSGASAFDDVSKSDWFYDAVNWAAKNNLVAGYGNRKFGPNNQVTREQLAAILFKYTQFKKFASKTSADLSKFKDYNATSAWAKDAVKWAVANGLISGFENGTIRPKGTATRGQLAVILKAYDQSIRK